MHELIEQLRVALEQVYKGPHHTMPSTSKAFKAKSKMRTRFKRMKGGLTGLPKLGQHH